jgi:hypothetical protein
VQADPSRDHDPDGNNDELGGSVAGKDKRQARPPLNHFKRLLEEACPKHAYPVRHKLKDCSMIRSFVTLGSLTWGVELDEGLDRSDMMPFPEKNTVMIVYGGCPLLARHRISSPSPRAPTRYGWGHRAEGCYETSFPLC